jgi:putative ribosome biogenesis GTPase RsgA|nr:MAG TPA: hypothetical protein [Caudoviricetes sp.]
MCLTIFDQGDSMKAHIQEEKKTATLELGKGTLFQNKDGKIYKVCDTAEYNDTHTDDEVIKAALSEENKVQEKNLKNIFNRLFVFAANNI